MSRGLDRARQSVRECITKCGVCRKLSTVNTCSLVSRGDFFAKFCLSLAAGIVLALAMSLLFASVGKVGVRLPNMHSAKI